jgi:hypothetical protein
MFKPDFDRYEGVRPINIYLLRLFYSLMFLLVGFDAWSTILGHRGPWDPMRAAAWCMFASYATLSILGVFRPLKMLPIFLFMIGYKSLWLATVAYPLWSANRLWDSPAGGMARIFMWVPIVIVIVPWKYVFDTYVRPRGHAGAPLPSAGSVVRR